MKVGGRGVGGERRETGRGEDWDLVVNFLTNLPVIASEPSEVVQKRNARIKTDHMYNSIIIIVVVYIHADITGSLGIIYYVCMEAYKF